jgi:hypothetical protein
MIPPVRLTGRKGLKGMTVEQLRATIKAVPFHPFTLRLSDGREIPIPHPDFIMYTPNNPRIVVVTLPDGTV